MIQCESGFTYFFKQNPKSLISWESFKNGTRVIIKSNGYDTISIAAYNPENDSIEWRSVPYVADNGKQQTIIFGKKSTIRVLWGLPINQAFINYLTQPDVTLTTGLKLEFSIMPSKTGYFGFYDPTSDWKNIVKQTFNEILSDPSIQSRTRLNENHFGIAKMISDADVKDPNQAQVLDVTSYDLDGVQLDYIPPKPHCIGSKGNDQSSGNESDKKPVSGKPVGEGSTIQSQKFPFWILIIPAVLLLLRFRKRR